MFSDITKVFCEIMQNWQETPVTEYLILIEKRLNLLSLELFKTLQNTLSAEHLRATGSE